MRAISYMRWSSEKQKKNSSLSRQTRKISELCARMEWPIAETLIDEGVSAYSGANMYEGHLSKLRERFIREGGDGWVLCVDQLDRLSRLDTLTVIEFFIAMTRTGLTIALADSKMIIDAHSLKNQTAQLEEIVRESHRANREGRVRSGRSKGAWDEMREDGRKVHTSSTCPAWLNLNKDRTAFTVIEDRAEVVRQIFRDYVAGISKRNIARKLNEAGVKPFRGAKLGWQPTAVIALLNSRAVLGEYRHVDRATGEPLGDPIKDYFGHQIVDNELWQQAHDARNAKVMTGRGREVHHRNVLQDIAVCGSCGWRMRMNRKTARAKASYVTTYLQCSNYDLRKGCDANRMWRVDRFEKPLLDHLLTLALDDQVWTDEAKVPVLAARLADERRELDDLTTRLGNVMMELERRPSERVSKRRDELEDEETALLAKISATEVELQSARGAVSPADHLKRVGEIRADMERDDEEGVRARKTIKMALNDVIVSMRIYPQGGAVVKLKNDMMLLNISTDGTVSKLDMKHPNRSYEDTVTDPAMKEYIRRHEAFSVAERSRRQP